MQGAQELCILALEESFAGSRRRLVEFLFVFLLAPTAEAGLDDLTPMASNSRDLLFTHRYDSYLGHGLGQESSDIHAISTTSPRQFNMADASREEKLKAARETVSAYCSPC